MTRSLAATLGLAVAIGWPSTAASQSVAQLRAEGFARSHNLLVIEAAMESAPKPIPLEAGGRLHGAMYDSFLLGVLAARAMLAAGVTPSPEVPGPGNRLRPLMLVVVAYPIACDGRTNAPQDVQLTASSGAVSGAVRKLETRGADPRSVLAGVELPDSALVVAFANAALINASVRIDYAGDACLAGSQSVTLPILNVPARPRQRAPVAKLPEQAATLPSPTTVRVRMTVDRAGAVRFPALDEGPAELGAAAAAAVEHWPFDPARINGIAVPMSVIFPLTFTATGAPPAATAPSPMATTTVGGSIPTMSTPSLPSFTPGSSRCAIAEDDTYGYAPDNPVKVGGDARIGPARERQYLNALRGPAGQGLRYHRLGSTRSPDQQTILDMYEITHDGLPAPVRLYLDEYHFDELKAPKGFVCATPFDLSAPTGPQGAAPVSSAAGAPAAPSPRAETTSDVPNLTAASSQCAISAEETYGVTLASPIRIGGQATTAVPREQQYLSALRGPAGQGLRFARVGAVLAPDRQTVLNIYEITYRGLDRPLRIYFDRSAEGTLVAPRGLVCAVPIEIKGP